MILELVHEASSQSTHLLRSGNREENNFRELLRPERSKHAPSEDLRPLAVLASHDDHGLVLTVHGELHYVVAGHPGQLLGYDVLQLDEVPHALQCPIKK